MGLLDSLKSTATKLLADNVLVRGALPKVQEALGRLEGLSADFLTDLTLFRAKLSDPSYNYLPAVLQNFVTPDHWHQFVLHMKDSLFVVEDRRIKLHPDVKLAGTEVALRLVFGDRWAEKGAEFKLLPPEAPAAASKPVEPQG